LALHAFLLAKPKEALLSVINAVEELITEDAEMSLQLGLQKDSVLSASLGMLIRSLKIMEGMRPAKHQLSARSAKGKQKASSKKAKAGKQDTEAAVGADSGWSGIPPLRKLHGIAVMLKNSNIHFPLPKLGGSNWRSVGNR
jgi:hypothetical protein